MRSHSTKLLMLALLLSAATPPPLAVAQAPKQRTTASSTPNKLLSLKVTGTARYTDPEILAASALQIGRNVSEADFNEAVRLLGNSGMFSAAAYSYTTSVAGTKLEIQLTDIDNKKLVPANFENFVWFTDDELVTSLQSHIPLFKRLVPLDGNLPDRVSEALQLVLSDKKLPGRVAFLRHEDQLKGSLTSIDYRVEEVTLRVRSIQFPGASPEQASLLATAARRAIGEEYARSSMAALARLDLLPVYLPRGFLKAAFAPSDARVLPTPSSAAQPPPEIEVDALIPVNAGPLYIAAGFDWKGNSAVSTSELAALLHLPPGQPADAVRLARDIETATNLYRSRGFIMARIKPAPEFTERNADQTKSEQGKTDQTTGEVHYLFNVVEGDLYRMGEIEITGLDTDAKARMVAAWTLHPGQPYNASYPKQFLEDTRRVLPRGVRWAAVTHESPDAKDKTVDVEIHFKQE